jgi:hypothetical protein
MGRTLLAGEKVLYFRDMEYIRLGPIPHNEEEIFSGSWEQLRCFDGRPFDIPIGERSRFFDSPGAYDAAKAALVDCSIPFVTDGRERTLTLDKILFSDKTTPAPARRDVPFNYDALSNLNGELLGILRGWGKGVIEGRPIRSKVIFDEADSSHLSQILDDIEFPYEKRKGNNSVVFVASSRDFHSLHAAAFGLLRGP